MIASHNDLTLDAAVRSLTEQTAMQAGTICRMTQEYDDLAAQFNLYRRNREPRVAELEAVTTDLATRVEQSLEALADALIRQEELGERSRYWEQRALHAEQLLAPRERLRVVSPEGAS